MGIPNQSSPEQPRQLPQAQGEQLPPTEEQISQAGEEVAAKAAREKPNPQNEHEVGLWYRDEAQDAIDDTMDSIEDELDPILSRIKNRPARDALMAYLEMSIAYVVNSLYEREYGKILQITDLHERGLAMDEFKRSLDFAGKTLVYTASRSVEILGIDPAVLKRYSKIMPDLTESILTWDEDFRDAYLWSQGLEVAEGRSLNANREKHLQVLVANYKKRPKVIKLALSTMKPEDRQDFFTLLAQEDSTKNAETLQDDFQKFQEVQNETFKKASKSLSSTSMMQGSNAALESMNYTNLAKAAGILWGVTTVTANVGLNALVGFKEGKGIVGKTTGFITGAARGLPTIPTLTGGATIYALSQFGKPRELNETEQLNLAKGQVRDIARKYDISPELAISIGNHFSRAQFSTKPRSLMSKYLEDLEKQIKDATTSEEKQNVQKVLQEAKTFFSNSHQDEDQFFEFGTSLAGIGVYGNAHIARENYNDALNVSFI